MTGSWKDNFKTSNFWPTHFNPELFIMSQWQSDKETPSLIYLCVRLAVFVSFFVIWILTYTMEPSAGKPRWPVFLTNWGMTLNVLQSFLSCLMLTCAIIGTKVLDNDALKESVLKCYKTYWVLNVMATSVAFTITFIYWTLIYKQTGSYWSTMNFMVHGFNSVLMFVDFCLVAHPVRFLHLIYPIAITFAYTIMTAIFYVCGGTMRDGSRYIYPILKWDQPVPTIGYCAAVLILLTIMHITTFFLYKLKTVIGNCIFGEDSMIPDGFEEQSTKMMVV
ncbi:unnamed protein product [Ceutorhynchus assimilis]|uniref:Protein rolling stone n=1 Tax=Ceutorhynchus assimilis TaxID=467358 RepID=A0A9N9ME88_9CUCU|nr:unnamed protein product [Ceutorhynchus assimilis]